MDAKRCDRCGMYYEKYADEKHAECKSAWNKTCTYFINAIGNFGKCSYVYDLCPSCWSSFTKWWEMKGGEDNMSYDKGYCDTCKHNAGYPKSAVCQGCGDFNHYEKKAVRKND